MRNDSLGSLRFLVVFDGQSVILSVLEMHSLPTWSSSQFIATSPLLYFLTRVLSWSRDFRCSLLMWRMSKSGWIMQFPARLDCLLEDQCLDILTGDEESASRHVSLGSSLRILSSNHFRTWFCYFFDWWTSNYSFASSYFHLILISLPYLAATLRRGCQEWWGSLMRIPWIIYTPVSTKSVIHAYPSM